jgi:hypothetical protein
MFPKKNKDSKHNKRKDDIEICSFKKENNPFQSQYMECSRNMHNKDISPQNNTYSGTENPKSSMHKIFFQYNLLQIFFVDNRDCLAG